MAAQLHSKLFPDSTWLCRTSNAQRADHDGAATQLEMFNTILWGRWPPDWEVTFRVKSLLITWMIEWTEGRLRTCSQAARGTWRPGWSILRKFCSYRIVHSCSVADQGLVYQVWLNKIVLPLFPWFNECRSRKKKPQVPPTFTQTFHLVLTFLLSLLPFASQGQ